MKKNYKNTILPILVYKTLIEETSHDKSMKIDEIKDYITFKYDVEISAKSITRYINELRSFDLNNYEIINKKRKGYYSVNLDPYFDDSELIYIKSLLQKSKNMSKKIRQNMMNKLDKLGSHDLLEDDYKYAFNSEMERVYYSSFIYFVKIAPTENRILSITYNINYKSSPAKLAYFSFFPYLYIPYDDDILIIGKKQNENKASIIKLSYIFSVKILEDKFDKIKIFFNLEKNTLGIKRATILEKLVSDNPDILGIIKS